MSKDVTFTAGLSDEETPEKKKKWHREEGTSAREGIHKGKIVNSSELQVNRMRMFQSGKGKKNQP